MPSIKVDAKARLGAFKPVNGIDNGPVCFGSLIDSSGYYKRAAFPYCRLHDTNYPHPREVDIPTIFKNFDADPDDPASYFFKATDIYLNDIAATGAKIIYRLGISIEHPKLKYYVDPPADFEKWAKICLNIARHYNEGWADGYHMDIQYWEVWNEPDQLAAERSQDVMWSGTPEQYYELYAVTAHLPIDIATFYEGQPVNLFATIFDRYGAPTKQYYAFDAFNRVKQIGERAALACTVPGVYAIASASDNGVCIMAANWDSATDTYECEIDGLDLDAEYVYDLYLLDERRDLEKVLTKKCKPGELPRGLYLHRNSVALVMLARRLHSIAT